MSEESIVDKGVVTCLSLGVDGTVELEDSVSRAQFLLLESMYELVRYAPLNVVYVWLRKVGEDGRAATVAEHVVGFPAGTSKHVIGVICAEMTQFHARKACYRAYETIDQKRTVLSSQLK